MGSPGAGGSLDGIRLGSDDVIVTGTFQVPVALLGPNQRVAQAVLAERTRKREWKEILEVKPIDNRVLWTFEDEVAKIFFRHEVEEGPRVGHG